jgi:dolichol-phosphate mannosyltransferase
VKLSVVIPAHNEEEAIGPTVESVVETLQAAEIEHEVLVIDDASTDRTASEVAKLAEQHPTVRLEATRSPRHGFGLAVRTGLELYEGDAVAIFMADSSDDAGDLVAYHGLLAQGLDCAFGSRFLPGAQVTHYPWLKLILNRIVNWGIRALFRHGYDDTTNAFKAYRREVIDNLQPLLAHHFNLTVELPLKAIVRGHSYGIVPISWENRAVGESKLRLQEMGSRYLFIVLYVFLEHHLSRGDYHRQGPALGRHRPRLGPSRPGAMAEIRRTRP